MKYYADCKNDVFRCIPCEVVKGPYSYEFIGEVAECYDVWFSDELVASGQIVAEQQESAIPAEMLFDEPITADKLPANCYWGNEADV